MPRLSIQKQLITANKPSGLNTHSPDGGKTRGLLEWLSEQRGEKLWPLHRLDKPTSGAILLTNDEAMARKFSELFEEKKIKKEYLFVSTHKPQEVTWSVESEITKDKEGQFTSDRTSAKPNAHTRFKYIKSQGDYHLIVAYPTTGKTHQIRLHASQSGVPIVGDSFYGGKEFFRLLLHAQKISWSETETFEVPAPEYFNDLSLIKDNFYCLWLEEINKRQILFPELWSGETTTLRLVNSEHSPLRIDKIGSCWILGWWHEAEPNDREQSLIFKLLKKFDIKQYILEFRGKSDRHVLASNLPEQWIANENKLNYNFRSQQGLNPGLFLDQREQRLWVKNNFADKNVLNLFAFTGGFSVSAAAGQANSVLTIDVSQNYLDWAKQNFESNGLDPLKYKFYAWDSMEFLQWCIKKQMTFDLVICDPPSFSRHEGKTWQMEKDWPVLFKTIGNVLKSQGQLLFSTNFEKWHKKRWPEVKTEFNKAGWKIKREFPPSWDFHFDDEFPLMKSVLLEKNF